MRLYAVHPTCTYRTIYEQVQLNRIAERFPYAEVVNPRDARWTAGRWAFEWPKVLPTIDLIVVFPDRDGYIGRSGYQEISDAVARGVPVHHLTTQGQWVEAPKYTRPCHGNWQRYARLSLRARALQT